MGVSVHFTCHSSDIPIWQKWNKTLYGLPDKMKIINTSLIIPRITKEDQGYYRCDGTTNERNIWSGIPVTFITYGSLVMISKYCKIWLQF